MKVKGLSEQALIELNAEVLRARWKFPDNNDLTVALGEEFGEMCQAQLQKEGRERVRSEALQVACVAMRIYEEGDKLYG